MCGRFTQTKSREEVLEQLGDIELPPLFHRRYNIAPTQQIAVIDQGHPDRSRLCTWGFIRANSPSPVINARHETLKERPMFRDLLAANRCLVPADGFYEWKSRHPYYFQLPDRSIFAFAGLWREERCVIITRGDDGNMQGIHDRMPVIIEFSYWASWLKGFELPHDAPALTARPVSPRVNSVTHDDPACIEPAEVQDELF